MKLRTFLLAVILLTLVFPLAGCGAGKPESALLRMLRFIPDKSDYRHWVSFGDAAAWHTSWDIPRLDDLDGLNALDRETRARWTSILPSQTWPATAIGHQYLLTGDQRDFYGFDLFNLDRWIEAGQPPGTITAVEFGFDGKQIADALVDSGYDDEDLDGGGTLYSILDDYEISFDLPTKVGQLGYLNRIALLKGQMVIARATDLVEDALDADSGDRRSLAENKEYRAAALALQDKALSGYGELVGVILTDDQDFSEPATYLDPVQSPEFLEELRQRFERDADDLPGWEVAAFATQHADEASYLTLLVVFDEGTDAEEAAKVLADRLEGYDLLRDPDRTLMEYCRCSLEQAIAVKAEGLPVALVTLRADNPSPTPEDESIVNTFVFSWTRLLFSRDTGFLVSD